MDFYLKQWRDQQESEQHPCAKIPKLVEFHQQQQHHPSGSALPLFVPEPPTKITTMSEFPVSPSASTRFPRMGSYFSVAQWQELELQALIYRYMVAGAAVPPELLQPIKKSVLHASPYLLHPLQHCQPSLLQTEYWGRGAMDPEPGRCRRTDGKKWRCSRDVVAGQKYCERHMHRGRNRSRKPVEIPTSAGGGGTLKPNNVIGGSSFNISGTSPSMGLLHLSHSSEHYVSDLDSREVHKDSSKVDPNHCFLTSKEAKNEDKGIFESKNEINSKSDGRVLRPFFDDWPRSQNEGSNSATNLSISMSGNLSSDVSLKLATGSGYDMSIRDGNENEREQSQLNWGAGWATNQVASMGGPLAEVLRSSTSNASPTSVLHQLPRGSASELSFVST